MVKGKEDDFAEDKDIQTRVSHSHDDGRDSRF
jgi:hypothetical protein